MRILHVCQPTTEGTAQVALGLVRAGLEHGHEVAVACPAQGMLAPRVRELGGTWHPLELVRLPGWSDLTALRKLRHLAQDFDVVHLHSSKAGAVGRLAVWSIGRRRPGVVFNPHGWSWLSSRRLRGIYVGIERLLTPLARIIVAVGDDELREGRDVLGARARLRLIRNGVDVQHFAPVDGADREPDEIVCVGRLAPQKGQDRLLRALHGMRSSDVRLTLVGTGPDEPMLRRLCSELGVASRVEFMGFDAPLPYLQRAAVVVMPSRWEGLPLALLEAMACGAPVVMTECGGSSALVGCGAIVTNDEAQVVDELARAIDELMASPQRRHQLGSLARARAMEAYDEVTTLQSYLAVWESAQSSRRPAR